MYICYEVATLYMYHWVMWILTRLQRSARWIRGSQWVLIRLDSFSEDLHGPGRVQSGIPEACLTNCSTLMHTHSTTTPTLTCLRGHTDMWSNVHKHILIIFITHPCYSACLRGHPEILDCLTHSQRWNADAKGHHSGKYTSHTQLCQSETKPTINQKQPLILLAWLKMNLLSVIVADPMCLLNCEIFRHSDTAKRHRACGQRLRRRLWACGMQWRRSSAPWVMSHGCRRLDTYRWVSAKN